MLDPVDTAGLENIGITSVNIPGKENDRPEQISSHYRILM